MNTNTPMYAANEIGFPKSCNATLDYEAIRVDGTIHTFSPSFVINQDS